MPARTKISQKLLHELEEYLEEKLQLDNTINLHKDSHLGQEDKKVEKLTVGMSNAEEGYMTLLSEGAILYQDGSIRLYIAKGTLQKWYNSIDDSFQGYVTTGHVDLNSHPIREGWFDKSHLKIVTDANGRSDLLVKPVINIELSTVKDLIIQDEPFAISSEFTYSDMPEDEIEVEEYAKLLAHNRSKGYDYGYIPITNNIDLLGFSFVGNPGNAKSGGYDPQILLRNEEERLKNKELLDSLLARLNKEEQPEEAVVEETAVEEEVKEEEVAEKEEVVEEAKEADNTAELLEQALTRIEELTSEVTELKQYKADKEAEELATQEKLEKLSALLNKSASVEKPEVAKLEQEKPKGIFGRERFGGLK